MICTGKPLPAIHGFVVRKLTSEGKFKKRKFCLCIADHNTERNEAWSHNCELLRTRESYRSNQDWINDLSNYNTKLKIRF